MENLLHASPPVSGGCQQSLALFWLVAHSTHLGLHLSMPPLHSVPSLLLFHTRTLLLDIGATLIQDDLISRSLISSGNKVTFAGSGSR